MRKRRISSRQPAWLVTKHRRSFAQKARANVDWLTQSSSRKLQEFVDLHPAERQMMHLWNAFLPRIRITMMGHKLRIFVSLHRHQIDQMRLRTHFLLFLLSLLNSNAIDGEEQYDLMMRLEPGYEPQSDGAHFVARELALLEQDRNRRLLLGQKGEQKLSKQRQRQQQLEEVTNVGKRRGRSATAIGQQQQQLPQKGQKPGSAGAIHDGKKEFHGRRHHQKLQLLPAKEQQSTATAIDVFKSVAELRSRYPFASNKRVDNIWKFMRQYDYHNPQLQNIDLNNKEAASDSWTTIAHRN